MAGLGATALLLTWLALPPNRSAADGAAALSGTVFYDKNDNGVRDPGEPGLGGIALHDSKSDAGTLTAADGTYAFPSLPSAGYVQIETGWFRSQCPPPATPSATTCPAGPGADDDFPVINQFIRYRLTGASASNVDVGLVPDWPGPSLAIPAAVAGAVPANPVDVAARASWLSGTCVNTTYAICRAGDTFTLAGQVLNQGTTALTGLRARVYVPPGDCATGVALMAGSIPAGLGALTVTPAAPTCSDRYIDLSLAGSLAPAAAVRIRLAGTTVAGPGTPGCNPTAINTTLCPKAEPQGRAWLLGVSHIDQAGDPDSTFCAAGDMTTCPTGLHDKRRAPDEIDPAGHNVDSTLGGTAGYDLSAHAVMLTPDTVRAYVSNTAAGETNASPAGVQVQIWLPAGTTTVTVPAKHALLACDAGRPAEAAVVVTCTFRGPIAPTVSSPSIDLTVASPPTRVVVCVTGPAGGPAESVPAVAGCGLATDASSTATDNDATLIK